MEICIKEVLDNLNWDNGFRIPIANERNKLLEKEIEEKLNRKKDLANDLELTKKHIESIDEFMKNIKTQNSYNQKVLTAFVSQYETEDHLDKIFKNEEASINQEINAYEKEISDIADKVLAIKAEISKLENEINNSRKVVEFDKVKILKAEEELNYEDEKQELIKKYIKLDQSKFKALNLKRKKLTEDLEEKNKVLTKLLDDVVEKEIILDRTAKFYKQAIEERHQLINRWSHSVFILRQRDSNIQNIAKEIETLNEDGHSKAKILLECEQFLESQNISNVQLQLEIKDSEKKLVALKDQFATINRNKVAYNTEYELRKNNLNDLEKKTKCLKIDLNNTKLNINDKKQKIDNLTEHIENLVATIASLDDDDVDVVGKVKQLEMMMEKEEKNKLNITKDINRFQDLNLRTLNQLNEIDGEMKTIENQKHHELKRIEVLAASQKKTEEMLNEKKNIESQLEMQLQDIKIRLDKYFGLDKDKSELNRKKMIIQELTGVFNSKQESFKLLQTQLVNLDNEIRKVQYTINADSEKLKGLNNRKKEYNQEIQGGEKQLKLIVQSNEEQQVTENILRLKVIQTEEMIKNTANKVYNFEKLNLTFDAKMKERMVEMTAQKETLILKKKLSQNDCSELRNMISEINSNINHIQSRYDNVITTACIKNVDDDEAIPQAVLHLKLKNAQNKYCLKEKGDKLDATIRKTEQEIKSMENTLKIVNACNERYKMSFENFSEDDENTKLMLNEKLDEEMQNVREKLKINKMELEKCENQLSEIKNDNEKLIETMKQLEIDKDKKYDIISGIENHILENKKRILRADIRLKKLIKDIQQLYEATNDDNILLQEKDIATRQLQDQNQLGLQRITEFIIRHVEAEVYIKKLLTNKNISLNYLKNIKTLSNSTLFHTSTTSMLSTATSTNNSSSANN